MVITGVILVTIILGVVGRIVEAITEIWIPTGATTEDTMIGMGMVIANKGSTETTEEPTASPLRMQTGVGAMVATVMVVAGTTKEIDPVMAEAEDTIVPAEIWTAAGVTTMDPMEEATTDPEMAVGSAIVLAAKGIEEDETMVILVMVEDEPTEVAEMAAGETEEVGEEEAGSGVDHALPK